MNRVQAIASTTLALALVNSLLQAAPPTSADIATSGPTVLTGKVTAVIGGDVVSVRLGEEDHPVRLAGIDAPEILQEFGPDARQVLAEMVLAKSVEVLVLGDDRQRPILGIVYSNLQCVNTVMVRRGCAWYYARHTKSKALENAQDEAKRAKRGIWESGNAKPPWIWLRSHRHLLAEGSEEIPDEFVAPEGSETEAETQPGDFWLNSSSGTRHNAFCRYYRNTKEGRPCKPDEGKPCSTCGG